MSGQGTRIHPFFIALRGELVLQLDMVEVLLRHVEAVDGDGEIVTR